MELKSLWYPLTEPWKPARPYNNPKPNRTRTTPEPQNPNTLNPKNPEPQTLNAKMLNPETLKPPHKH